MRHKSRQRSEIHYGGTENSRRSRSMSSARIGRLDRMDGMDGMDRMDRIHRINSASGTACRHPVDPVHPVQSSSSSGQVGKVIRVLLYSVSPCLRGESLPSFLMHTPLRWRVPCVRPHRRYSGSEHPNLRSGTTKVTKHTKRKTEDRHPTALRNECDTPLPETSSPTTPCFFRVFRVFRGWIPACVVGETAPDERDAHTGVSLAWIYGISLF